MFRRHTLSSIERILGPGAWKTMSMVLVAAIVVAGFFLIRSGMGLLIGSSLEGEDESKGDSASVAGVLTGSERKVLTDYADILRQNPFGKGPAGELVPLGTRGEVSRGAVPPSPSEGGAFELAGTIVKEDGYRYAILEPNGGKGGSQVLAKEGETVPGVGRIAAIGPGSVVVQTSTGEREFLVRDVAVMGKNVPPRGRKFTPRKPQQRAPQREDNTQIQQISEGTFRLSKEGIQAAIKNPQKIMTEARMLPYIKDGVQEGFVVREVKQGGIYDGLGLANGDILLRVNDLDLKSPDSALQAFGALQGLDRIRLEIIRGGENRTLVYHIE